MNREVPFVLIVMLTVSYLVGCFGRSRQSEVLLADRIDIGTDWKEIRAVKSLRNDYGWSELLLELPREESEKTDGESADKQVQVEAYLVADDGQKISLDQNAVVRYNTTVFLQLSNDRVESRQSNYRFQALALRANRPVQLGKVIWMSYAPQDFKGGVAFPTK